MSLKGLELKPAYHKGADDIASSFYLPCMQRSVLYRRAVGYFSSSIYVLAWPALREFVRRGGRIQLICSPSVSPGDALAIKDGYSNRDAEDAASLMAEVRRLFDNQSTRRPAQILAALIGAGIVDIKIATPALPSDFEHRLFHDKVGIFSDEWDNSVVFKGSMNESWAGLSLSGNIESVDIYLSWGEPRERMRVTDETAYFTSLWDNHYPPVKIHSLPADVTALLNHEAVSDWESATEAMCHESGSTLILPTSRPPLYQHQKSAIDAWEAQNRCGIFEHATGSGKTITALALIAKALEAGEVPLILVPTEILLLQWQSELRGYLGSEIDVLSCGGGNRRWSEKQELSRWSSPGAHKRIILSTMQTAASSEFQVRLSQGEKLFLVVDEVHRMGSPELRKLTNISCGPRVGLSATPRRSGDPEGTQILFDYFGGIIPPPFTLKDAISIGSLTPYMYFPSHVRLSGEEQQEWNKLSARLAALSSAKPAEHGTADTLKQILIKRARVAKNAAAKIPLAAALLQREFKPGQKWLVYCDSIDQIKQIAQALRQKTLSSTEYYSSMSGDKSETLRNFELNGGILLSVRCLDEGVNIPSVTHALILASSRNPREFIQRRGRVLRRARDKPLAFIHDVLVLPSEGKSGGSFLEAELARAIEFGKHANNPSAITALCLIATEGNLDLSGLAEGGFEDGEEENE